MDISQLSAAADTLASILSSQKAQREQVASYALAQGLSFLQDKKYDRAISEFKRAIAFNPNSSDAYQYLGKVYQTTGKTNDAIETFKKGVQQGSTPQDTSYQALTSQGFTSQGTTSQGTTTYEDLIISLGNAYIEAKQYDQAEKQFKKLAQVDPTTAYPHNSLGYIYLTTNRISEAEDQFKKVIQMAPRDGNGYYGLGLVYNKEKKFGEAVDQFEEAISLKKKFSQAYSDLGYAYIGLGNTTKAQEQVKILSDLDPTLARNLQLSLFTPKITNVLPLDSTFPSVLGPLTSLSVLDASLATPGQSKTFSLTFQFNQKMDLSSVQNPLNWFISKASGGTAGYYNNGITIHPEKEIMLSPIPSNVSYDPVTYKATIFFTIAQNAAGNGVMDPSHWVFKFKGTDISGHIMDKSGDEYDGFALSPF
jgi:tetratricopeptide (TPR) repeat protein